MFDCESFVAIPKLQLFFFLNHNDNSGLFFCKKIVSPWYFEFTVYQNDESQIYHFYDKCSWLVCKLLCNINVYLVNFEHLRNAPKTVNSIHIDYNKISLGLMNNDFWIYNIKSVHIL